MRKIIIKKVDIAASTNDLVRQAAENGTAEGLVIIAKRQSKGRGRMGRSFLSEKGGLYMSVLLRPSLPPEKSTYITTAAAAAVAKAVEKHTKKEAFIKWVNDVYLDFKKVCGILTEGKIKDNSLEYAVLGIGLNVNMPKEGFGALSGIATSMFECDGNTDEIAKDILEYFFEYYENLALAPHYEDYCRRNMLMEKEVSVMKCGEEVLCGRVCGIDKDFAIQIEQENKIHSIFSGEVSVCLTK